MRGDDRFRGEQHVRLRGVGRAVHAKPADEHPVGGHAGGSAQVRQIPPHGEHVDHRPAAADQVPGHRGQRFAHIDRVEQRARLLLRGDQRGGGERDGQHERVESAVGQAAHQAADRRAVRVHQRREDGRVGGVPAVPDPDAPAAVPVGRPRLPRQRDRVGRQRDGDELYRCEKRRAARPQTPRDHRTREDDDERRHPTVVAGPPTVREDNSVP